MSDIRDMKIEEERQIFIKSLEQKRDEAGLNDASLSKKAGLNPTAVRDIIQKQKNMPRYDTLEALARALECSVDALVKGFKDNDTVLPTGHNMVKVVGYVQAGFFGEADELSVRDEDVMYVSPKYPDAHCLIVKGDSMNERYQDGTKLICVPFDGDIEDIKPGRAVIVEAISADDGSEYTVKEFFTDKNGNHWLIPRSTNPEYQNYPIPKRKDQDVTINGHRIKSILIKALVVSSQFDEN